MIKNVGLVTKKPFLEARSGKAKWEWKNHILWVANPEIFNEALNQSWKQPRRGMWSGNKATLLHSEIWICLREWSDLTCEHWPSVAAPILCSFSGLPPRCPSFQLAIGLIWHFSCANYLRLWPCLYRLLRIDFCTCLVAPHQSLKRNRDIMGFIVALLLSGQ